MKKYLEVGKIVNTHGIRGEVKLELWCDSAEYLKQFSKLYLDENGNSALNLVSARPQKNFAILKFKEISSIDEAEKYRNKILYGDRDDAVIEDGAVYIQDIIGCRVIDCESEKCYGEVADVLNYGASDILEIKGENGKNYIPYVDEFAVETDIENGVILVKPIKGLFNED